MSEPPATEQLAARVVELEKQLEELKDALERLEYRVGDIAYHAREWKGR